MKLKVNGTFQQIQTDKNVLDLELVIKKLDLNPKLIVVEFNGVIITRKNWAEQKVKDGDVLEIVTIVGGGSF